MKKKFFLMVVLIPLIIASCRQDDYTENLTSNKEQILKPEKGINKQGKIDGLNYSLEDILINPDLIVLNAENLEKPISVNELADGIVRVASLQEDLSQKLTPGTILYINTGEYKALKKVESISSGQDGRYVINVVQAHLGEAFQGGSINLSLDLFEKNVIEGQKNPLLKSASYGVDHIYELLNIAEVYDWKGFKYSPATNVKMLINMGLSFKKSQVLPSQLSTIFEIQVNMNPSLLFASSYNGKYEDDLIKYVPQKAIEYLKAQEFDIEIPINTLGIESIPAKVSIKDINIPTEIEANLSKESNLTYGLSGSLKTGYIIDINGLKATVKPVFQNTLKSYMPSTSGIYGEVLTKTDIAIIPNIALLNNGYNVSGNIIFGVKTITNGNITLPKKSPVFGSKGVFYSSMNVLVDLLLIKVPVEIFNNEKELWSKGTIDKTITYSDLKWNVTSQNTTNILNSTRSYKTNFTLNYKYPILGKRIPDILFISYDVFQKNGSTRLSAVTDAKIVPSDVTENSFTFTLDIPYKKEGGILSSKYETTSFIKNIVIKDNNGYLYEGIFNTSKNIVENSFGIVR